MKNTLMLLIFGIIALPAWAQYNIPEMELAKEVLTKKLAVELIQENTDEDKYTNDALKKMFANEWKLTEIEFFTSNEFEDLMEAGNTAYAYLGQTSNKRVDERSKKVYANGKVYNPSVAGSGAPTGNVGRVAFTFLYYEFTLNLIGKKKPRAVTRIGFANGELSSIDFLYLGQQLTRLMNAATSGTSPTDFYSVEKNQEILKSSKLLIPAEYIKDKEKEKVGSYYKSDFELVDLDTYQDAILGKQANTTYVKIIWSIQHDLYIWVAVNAANGQILTQTSFGGIQFGSHHEANDIIKVKHLGYAHNAKAQKFNSKYK